jgi:hypothetical protein
MKAKPYILLALILLLLGLVIVIAASSQTTPNIYYEHVFVNGGGECTRIVEGSEILLNCKNLPTDIRSKVSLSFVISPDSGAVTDGDLTEIEHDGYPTIAHNMFGITNLPDRLKIGEYILTATFNGDRFFGATKQFIHVGRVGKDLKVFILRGTTTIDNQ